MSLEDKVDAIGAALALTLKELTKVEWERDGILWELEAILRSLNDDLCTHERFEYGACTSCGQSANTIR